MQVLLPEEATLPQLSSGVGTSSWLSWQHQLHSIHQSECLVDLIASEYSFMRTTLVRTSAFYKESMLCYQYLTDVFLRVRLEKGWLGQHDPALMINHSVGCDAKKPATSSDEVMNGEAGGVQSVLYPSL